MLESTDLEQLSQNAFAGLAVKKPTLVCILGLEFHHLADPFAGLGVAGAQAGLHIRAPALNQFLRAVAAASAQLSSQRNGDRARKPGKKPHDRLEKQSGQELDEQTSTRPSRGRWGQRNSLCFGNRD